MPNTLQECLVLPQTSYPGIYVTLPLFFLSPPRYFCYHPQVCIFATALTPTTTTGNSVLPETGLEINSLQHAVQRYYHMGLAQSTWKSYTTRISHHTRFVNLAARKAVSIPESIPPPFCLVFRPLNLSHSTIKLYF